MRRMAWVLCAGALWCGCEGSRSAPSAASTTPATTSATGPVPLPDGWQRCTNDAECTFVSLGCCSTTPVRRERAQAAQNVLNESGRRECPVKQACGPLGTWEGAPGRCIGGTCACDPAAPMASTCLGQ